MCFSKCPHHVRHGKLADDGKNIEFKNLCGLKMKREQDPEAIKPKGRGRGRPAAEVVKRKPLAPGETLDCANYPFDDQFDYFRCFVYQDNFQSTGLKNGVVPTRDFQYSESLAGDSITDMELL